jgi:hypothetical protein
MEMMIFGNLHGEGGWEGLAQRAAEKSACTEGVKEN